MADRERGKKNFPLADPGEGRPFPYFKTKLSPEGLKNFFLRPGPPVSQGVDDRAFLLSEGLGPPLLLPSPPKQKGKNGRLSAG